MPLPSRTILLSVFALAASATAMPINQATPNTSPAEDDTPVHVRCAQLRPGMNYREALALMGREPDSTLSAHSAAGPEGDPPAGSYAVDFWNGTDAQGQAVVSSVRYSGGMVESVECGRTTRSPEPPQASSPSSSGT
ncbi:hypothetical protein [Pseudoxanthomonas suwonensis]|uniref:Secreted protein n=1 Tax=Pseudoxanthomonas suwonensis TaxID=314722 RepID=A0A0E3UP59_9GAMM|nr:hypothetical protein [Pseudoxanthomonas suwonensis]AKC87781.1 hypothetical protein WQ53_14455 [Pseudoxanthomonas suwonensis]